MPVVYWTLIGVYKVVGYFLLANVKYLHHIFCNSFPCWTITLPCDKSDGICTESFAEYTKFIFHNLCTQFYFMPHAWMSLKAVIVSTLTTSLPSRCYVWTQTKVAVMPNIQQKKPLTLMKSHYMYHHIDLIILYAFSVIIIWSI